MKTADEFIEFYQTIPKEKWSVGNLSFGQDCAMGHIREMARSSHECIDYYLDALMNLLRPIVVARTRKTFPLAPAMINDNSGGLFSDLGDHPKERILNALRLAKKMRKRVSIDDQGNA